MRCYESEAAALRGLKASSKVLALVLAARMNDAHDDWPGRPVCWPSLDALAEDADLKERSVRYAIDELVKAKVIRVYKEREPGARWAHNVYEWTATLSPNYHPDWMKRPDKQKSSVGARLTSEGWEYCEKNQVGPHIAAAEHPELVHSAEQPTLVDTTASTKAPPEAPVPEAPKKSARKASKTKAYAIPEDWQPDEKTLARTREQYPSMPIDIEVRKFVAYWRDKGTKRPGWERTWGRWCANGDGFANGAWAKPPTPGQGAPVVNPATGKAATKEDFWYACIDHGIDPSWYINYWKPNMGLPGDPGWPKQQAFLNQWTGRA